MKWYDVVFDIVAVASGNPILAGLATYNTYKKVKTGLDNKDKMHKAYDSYQKAAASAGISNLNIQDVINELYMSGKISLKEYKQSIKAIKDWEGEDPNDWQAFWYGSDSKKAEKYIDFLNILANNIPEFSTALSEYSKELPDSIRESFTSKIPAIADAPAPSYEDTSFEGFQREVEPVKLWTGQELADLHNLDYNPNDYYNLIKQGTEADVNLSEYTADQLAHASMIDDTKQVTDYLDSIRNTKADAIATGATLGARRANELLNNTETIDNYAANQLASAQNQYNAVDDQLLADAEAQLTARQYFDQLAKTLSGHSDILYANDTDRFGQDWLSNAEMYTADQNLRGMRAYVNGQMAGAYAQAQAGVNAARKTAAAGDADLNEFQWVFDNFLRTAQGNQNRNTIDKLTNSLNIISPTYANNFSTYANNLLDKQAVAKAVTDMDDYLFSRYNGMSMNDYISNALKK